MSYKSKNNAKSKLASPINATALSITVQTGDGDLFPVITAGDFTYITLENAAGNREIIKISARAAASDTLTIDTVGRGQEGTTARSWSTGDVVSLRLTSSLLDASVAHPTQTAAAHAASAISNIPHGNVASTDVQSAINELDTEKFDVTNTLAATSKATPVDADVILLIDSVTGLLNILTWGNLKATLKTYFDTLYLAINALLTPPGSFLDFGGNTAPSGYLVCPLSLTHINATTYSGLAFAIGTVWGNGGTTVNAGSFVPGNTYVIKTVGTTNFTAIGASSNTVGVTFKATGAGSGTGVANDQIALPSFPADYANVQANSNVGTSTIGAVLAHTHTVTGGAQTGSGGSAGVGTAGTAATQNTYAQSPAGASANLPAGMRVLRCIKY